MTDEGDTPLAKKQKGSKSYPKGVIETGRNTIKYQGSTGQLQAWRQDGAAQRWKLRHSGGGGATDSCLRGEACRRHRPLGWSADSLSAQARPGVRSTLVIPCPCAPHAGWAPLAQARPPVRNERRRKVGTKVNLSASEGRERGPNADEGATKVRPQAKLQGRNTRSCRRPSETLAARPCPRGCCRMLGHGLPSSPWTAQVSWAIND